MAATLTLAERKAIEETIRERWMLITTIYDVQVNADQGSRAYLRMGHMKAAQARLTAD